MLVRAIVYGSKVNCTTAPAGSACTTVTSVGAGGCDTQDCGDGVPGPNALMACNVKQKPNAGRSGICRGLLVWGGSKTTGGCEFTTYW